MLQPLVRGTLPRDLALETAQLLRHQLEEALHLTRVVSASSQSEALPCDVSRTELSDLLFRLGSDPGLLRRTNALALL
jgi:hypothetical protein